MQRGFANRNPVSSSSHFKFQHFPLSPIHFHFPLSLSDMRQNVYSTSLASQLATRNRNVHIFERLLTRLSSIHAKSIRIILQPLNVKFSKQALFVRLHCSIAGGGKNNRFPIFHFSTDKLQRSLKNYFCRNFFLIKKDNWFPMFQR